jgi:hypothetical protein
MAINTSGQPNFVKALTSVSGGARSWTGNSGQSATIRYTFDYTKNFSGNQSLRELDAQEKSVAQQAMQYWQNVSNISFLAADANNPHKFVLAGDNFLVAAGSAVRQYSPTNSSKIVSADLFYNDIGLSKGESGFQTFVHEIGHVLGLSHPNNSAEDSNYDQSTTTMSYNMYMSNAGDTLWSFTPMMYDIAAAQYLYGVNTSYNSGNTTYGNTYITGEKRLWTIWDAGGVDKIDVSQLAIVPDKIKIDLRGQFEKLPTNDNNILMTRKKLIDVA